MTDHVAEATPSEWAPPCACEHCTRPTSRWVLCQDHGDELGQLVSGIGDTVLDRLSAAPRSSTAEPGAIPGGGLKSHRSPVNLDTIVLRDPRSKERDPGDPDGNRARSLLEVLHAYAMEVREGFHLPVPDDELAFHIDAWATEPVCEGRQCGHAYCWQHRWPYVIPWRPTVATERGLLVKYLDWCRRQPFAPDMLRELRAVVRQLSGEAPARPVGVCPDCTGDLWQTDGGGKQRGVRCSGCGRKWSGLELAQLRAGAA